MSGKYLDILKQKVIEILKDDDVKVFLFGSRAGYQGVASSNSDVDIGIIPGSNFDRKKLIYLRQYLEDSTLPYKVEVVDFSLVSEEFKNSALKEAQIWKS